MPDKATNPELAAAMLKTGKLVAFPTETVYGLGADATSSAACKRIFEAKGRPSNNPLIVHVADIATARHYVADWPMAAQRLAEAFWPGPLTLVLPKHPSICREVSAGRETVAVRVPDHPLALSLLRAFGGPVAAPSANKSTRVSPTTAEHVREEFGDTVDLVLDGGSCPVGIESTVLDLTTFPKPTLLRPGHVSVAQLEPIVGPIAVSSRLFTDEKEAAPSPGMSALHYAPTTPAFRFNRDEYPKVIARLGGTGTIEDEIDRPPLPDLPLPADTRPCSLVMLLSKASIPAPHDVMTMPVQADLYARVLYADLRSADVGGYNALFIEMPPDAPEWLAVRDRLSRATRPLAEAMNGKR